MDLLFWPKELRNRQIKVYVDGDVPDLVWELAQAIREFMATKEDWEEV